MSYATLIERENIASQFLVVVAPRRVVTGFTLFSGSVYQVAFDYTEWVRGVKENGVSYTQVYSTSLAVNQFYFDDTNQVLYVRTSDSSNPSTKTIVAEYELYFGTYDAHHYRIPTDDTSKQVYFEPLITQSPQFKQTIGDILFGVLPVQSTQLVLNNAEHILEKHLYDSTFNKAHVQVFHWLDKLLTTNIKLVLEGSCQNVTYSESTVTIKLLDRVDDLTGEWRNTDLSFYGSNTFPNLNPNFSAKPIRYVFGRVPGFIPVNIDYVNNNPTTSDNREWVCVGEQTGNAEVSSVVVVGANTTTTTQVTSAVGFVAGDTIWLDTTIDKYATIESVNYGTNVITHTSIASPVSPGDIVRRGFVSAITIKQNGIFYYPLYGRDYTATNFAGGTKGFTFTTTLEANLSMPQTLSVNDEVWCTVYGPVNAVTLGGPVFGGNDAQTGNLISPAVILFHILKTKVGITEAGLDTASFQTLLTDVGTQAISFSIPDSATGTFPSYKNLILSILKTSLIRMWIDSDLKWSVSTIKPVSVSDKEIEIDEMLNDSFKYSFDYKDIVSDVVIEYNRQERSETTSGERIQSLTVTSETAKFLHKMDKTQTQRSLFFRSADAQTLGEHMSFILGDRNGQIDFRSKNRFFDTYLNDVIEVNRSKLPGFTFNKNTLRSRQGILTDVSKTLRDVSMTLDDIKGIQDNQGDW